MYQDLLQHWQLLQISTLQYVCISIITQINAWKERRRNTNFFHPSLPSIDQNATQPRNPLWSSPMFRLLAIHFLCNHFKLSFTASYRALYKICSCVTDWQFLCVGSVLFVHVCLFRTCHDPEHVVQLLSYVVFMITPQGFLTPPCAFQTRPCNLIYLHK